MKKIDPRSNLSTDESLILYWFYAFKKVKEESNLQYSDFKPTETLINDYNKFVDDWNQYCDAHPEQCGKAVDWNISRPKTEYFSQQLQAGHIFENWVENEFKKHGVELGFFTNEDGQYSGENKFGIEIKNDLKLSETGNIYIEYKERLKKELPWTNSGILKDDNTKYWLIGSQKEYYIIKKSSLISIYNQLVEGKIITGCRFVKEIDHGTSLGFIMNRKKAKEICESTNIDEFISSFNNSPIFYARGLYFHKNRKCKYIVNKEESELLVFNSMAEATKAGYKKCTAIECFEMNRK